MDDLQESFKIENNKLKPLSGELLYGRDYKTTDKFTRYDFERTDTGFIFKNANFEDIENEKMFGISGKDLSDNLPILKNLSPKSAIVVNDFTEKWLTFGMVCSKRIS